VGSAFQAAAGLRPGVDADWKVGGRLKAGPHFADVDPVMILRTPQSFCVLRRRVFFQSQDVFECLIKRLVPVLLQKILKPCYGAGK
jgi:hypothetical protein